jgi:hypothetical protein
MTRTTDLTLTRRALLQASIPAAMGTALLATTAVAQQPAAAAFPKLEESDPAAKALGYVHDVKKVDPKTNPTFKAGQNCANCLQIQGKAGETWRGCNIFPKKLVNANGWCRVWVKKPGTA